MQHIVVVFLNETVVWMIQWLLFLCWMNQHIYMEQEVVKARASFGSTDGSHLLHLYFDNITEYDPDVVFDKNAIFSAFSSKWFFFFFYETYLHSSVDKKNNAWSQNKTFLFESRGSDLYFDVLHVQIFIQQNILGAMKFLWKSAKTLAVAGNFFQKRWRGKR